MKVPDIKLPGGDALGKMAENVPVEAEAKFRMNCTRLKVLAREEGKTAVARVGLFSV